MRIGTITAVHYFETARSLNTDPRRRGSELLCERAIRTAGF